MRSVLLSFAIILNTQTNAQQWNWAVDAGGGGNTDFCWGIATDSQGNAYWVGSVSGTADFGCATLAPGSTIAGVVAKYDASGACQWVRGITVGFNDAWAYGIAIDAEDRIYVTGSYDGNADFGNGITLNSLGGDDIFLARYDVDGTCLWARRAGSNASSDEARGVAVSDDGGVFITGFSGGNPMTFDAITIPNPLLARQLVIARYDSTGTALWAKSTTGTGTIKSARSIAVTGDRLFITGQIGYTQAFFDGMPITPVTNSLNLYVLACDLQGAALWARSYGSGDHEGFSIAADTLGNLFVAGRMWGDLYLPDDTLASVSSDDDILLIGMDQDGSHRWAKRTGSVERDLAWDVVADGTGNAYVAGQFHYTIDFFGPPLIALGSEDTFIAKVEADGDVVWAKRASGYQRDIALCIHRQAAAPHKLHFGGYFWGAITYGSSTIDDVANGDAMMVSGIDTIFDVSAWGNTVCPGSCDGEAIAFCNGEAPFTFIWNTGATTQEIDALCPGEYIVEVTDVNGEVRIDTVFINEEADPGFTVQASGSTLSIIGGVAYEWYFNDEAIMDSDTASIQALDNGDYHALVTTAEGCVFSSDTLAYIGMGLRDPSGVRGMNLYPSPASDHITIRATRPITRLWVVTALGEVLPMRYDGTSKIDVSTLAPGLYFLRAVLNDGSVIGETFVKE